MELQLTYDSNCCHKTQEPRLHKILNLVQIPDTDV